MELTWRGRALLVLVVAACVLFLLAPLAIVVPVSFSSASYLQFPPPSYSFRWYDSYFSDNTWIDATILSVKLGLTVAAGAVGLGLLAAISLVRLNLPLKRTIRMVLMAPLIVPAVVVAIAVYKQYADLHLIGSFWGVAAAHTILALPFSVMLLTNGLQQLDFSMEEASYTLGANRIETYLRVVVPRLIPSIVSAALVSFIISWDEVIMVIFIGGSEATTLPLKMFSYLKTEINPTIAAISTLLIGLAVLAVAIVEIRNAFSRSRQTTSE